MSLEIEKDAKSQDVKVKSKKCGNPCVHIIRAQENYKHWKEEKYEKHCMDEESNCYKLSETKCCKCCCCVCCGCCNAVKYILICINIMFFICGLGLMGIGAYGVFKFDMGAGFLGFLSLLTGMMGFGSVMASFLGIQGSRLRRKEGCTEMGQFLLVLYIVGIATVMFVEFMAVIFITYWCNNKVDEISAIAGPDAGQTINYNLGNNLANCSFNDCCPNKVGFEKYQVSEGIWNLPDENITWLATCVHVYDKVLKDSDSPAPFGEEFLVPSPSPNMTMMNATQGNGGGGTGVLGTGPSSAGDGEAVTPLKKVDLIGNRQMCTLFEEIQTYDNCMDFYTYDQAVRRYLWNMVEPLQTFLIVVMCVELTGFIAAWFSLLWCCGAGSMKIDIDDSDDDEHEWEDDEHLHSVKPHELHHV